MDPPHEGLIRRPIAPWANTLTRELHLAPPWRIDPTTHRTMSKHSYHGATSCSTMKDRSDDPSHHEQSLLPRSYISLHHEGSIRRPIAPWANALTTELHLAPPWRIDPTTHRTMSERSYHGATSCSTMKDWSDDPSHHERTLLPRSYISLLRNDTLNTQLLNAWVPDVKTPTPSCRACCPLRRRSLKTSIPDITTTNWRTTH